ncbi:MAG: 50S ribosomal protein L24 [Candidatus Aminicenantes bacterium]|nr:50S ribosomal protein L24 [Candidatus Aminicenantes bacterium]
MAKVRIKKGDTVIVIRGKDKGKIGKVLRVIPEEERLIVEKVNFVKEFIRRDRSRNIQGGIMEKEAPIHVSNVLLFCSECNRGVRIKNKILDDGSKIRVCHRCESSLDRLR